MHFVINIMVKLFVVLFLHLTIQGNKKKCIQLMAIALSISLINLNINLVL